MKKLKEWVLENQKTIIKLVICFVGLVVTTRYVGHLANEAEKVVNSKNDFLNELRNSETYNFYCNEGNLAFSGSYEENITTLNYKEEDYYISDRVIYNEDATISDEQINYVSPFDVYELIVRGNHISTINDDNYKIDVYVVTDEKYNHYFDLELKEENSNISVAYNSDDIKLTVDNLICNYVK